MTALRRLPLHVSSFSLCYLARWLRKAHLTFTKRVGRGVNMILLSEAHNN